MELPEKPTTTTSSIGHRLPIVHSLNTNLLIDNGWERNGTTYTKGDDVLKYNGVKWLLNGMNEVQFLEDLNDKK